jgi:hypothetical protein
MICEGAIRIGSQQLKFLTVMYAIIRLTIAPTISSAGCKEVVNAYHIKNMIMKVYMNFDTENVDLFILLYFRFKNNARSFGDL